MENNGERGEDVLGNAVGEVLLLGVGRHVIERQHRDRRPAAEARHRGGDIDGGRWGVVQAQQVRK